MLRSKISMSVSAALLLGLVSITGCGTNTAEKSNVQTNSVRGVNDGRIGVNSVRGGTHNITKMEVSQELADRIAAMPEVRSANVMLAGKSAYVAVTLNDATALPACQRDSIVSGKILNHSSQLRTDRRNVWYRKSENW